MKAFEGISISPAGWMKATCYAVVLFLVYYTALKELYSQWSGEEYSYCWFIPFIVLYLIWEKRAELGRLPSSPSWQGLALLCIGIFLFWLGELGGEYTTLYVSLWFVIIGIVWLHIGRDKMKSIAFPFVVMLAMFPLPTFVYTRVTLWAKMVSSQLGAWMLQAAGMPVYREGNIIDLGFTRLQVVDACSGLRYIVPMMLIGLLIAYWFKGHIWKKTALFLLSLPLSIFMNSFRIAFTGMLYSIVGPAAAEGFFHGFSGWLVFMAAFPVFLAGMWVLKRLPPRDAGSGDALVHVRADAGAVESVTPENQDKEASTVKRLLLPQFIVSMAMLLLTFGFSHGVEFRQKVPVSKPFNEFPMEVGEWKGTSEQMESQFRNALNFSDYIIANYRNPQGKTVNFYVAYYQDQRKGESIHSPESCLPGSGWDFKDAGAVTVPLNDGGSSLPVSRAYMEKAGMRELTYYWFPQRGRTLTKLYELKLFTFWDALTKQRTDGALVRVITPVYDSEGMKDAEERLQSFTRKIVPVLEGFIPGKDLR
ncbi:MAG TPA: VPLPA-CTERM-specific exosortase XrtD [Thermodesulfovibrionales bacterium]|nr:VPLPA-CTERM-specific exosortase XrtD [Thermodesulfovibrionales bacterium]